VAGEILSLPACSPVLWVAIIQSRYPNFFIFKLLA
jgi:hypothetical protein